MHRMSAQGSDQEEIKAWVETSLKPPAGLEKCLGEVEACNDQLKSWWSQSREKEEFEEKPMVVFFTHGSLGSHWTKPRVELQEEMTTEELD